MFVSSFEYQDKDDADGPSFWWVNPWSGEREKIASLFWPTHPADATAQVEALFESFSLVERGARPKAILAWAVETFGGYARKPGERARRLLEEAVEFAQAAGLTREDVDLIARRAYERPPGDPAKELAQVACCVESAAAALSLDLSAIVDAEFARCRAVPKEEWARRVAGKKAAGTEDVG